jgi:hypothetical protein
MDEILELDETMNRVRRKLLEITRTFFRVTCNTTCHRLIEAQYAEWTQPKKLANALFVLRRAAVWPEQTTTQTGAAAKAIPPSQKQLEEDALACRSALLYGCPSPLVSLLGEQSTQNGSLKVKVV